MAATVPFAIPAGVSTLVGYFKDAITLAKDLSQEDTTLAGYGQLKFIPSEDGKSVTLAVKMRYVCSRKFLLFFIENGTLDVVIKKEFVLQDPTLSIDYFKSEFNKLNDDSSKTGSNSTIPSSTATKPTSTPSSNAPDDPAFPQLPSDILQYVNKSDAKYFSQIQYANFDEFDDIFSGVTLILKDTIKRGKYLSSAFKSIKNRFKGTPNCQVDDKLYDSIMYNVNKPKDKTIPVKQGRVGSSRVTALYELNKVSPPPVPIDNNEVLKNYRAQQTKFAELQQIEYLNSLTTLNQQLELKQKSNQQPINNNNNMQLPISPDSHIM